MFAIDYFLKNVLMFFWILVETKNYLQNFVLLTRSAWIIALSYLRLIKVIFFKKTTLFCLMLPADYELVFFCINTPTTCTKLYHVFGVARRGTKFCNVDHMTVIRHETGRQSLSSVEDILSVTSSSRNCCPQLFIIWKIAPKLTLAAFFTTRVWNPFLQVNTSQNGLGSFLYNSFTKILFTGLRLRTLALYPKSSQTLQARIAASNHLFDQKHTSTF